MNTGINKKTKKAHKLVYIVHLIIGVLLLSSTNVSKKGKARI